MCRRGVPGRRRKRMCAIRENAHSQIVQRARATLARAPLRGRVSRFVRRLARRERRWPWRNGFDRFIDDKAEQMSLRRGQLDLGRKLIDGGANGIRAPLPGWRRNGSGRNMCQASWFLAHSGLPLVRCRVRETLQETIHPAMDKLPDKEWGVRRRRLAKNVSSMRHRRIRARTKAHHRKNEVSRRWPKTR